MKKTLCLFVLNDFLAKGSGESYESHVKKVVENVDLVIERLELKKNYKKMVSVLSKAAAYLHDLGKLTPENQEILRDNKGILRHSAISAAMSRDLFSKLPNLQLSRVQDVIIYAVFWHHQVAEEELGIINSRKYKIPLEEESKCISFLTDLDSSFRIEEHLEANAESFEYFNTIDSAEVFSLKYLVLTILIESDRLASGQELLPISEKDIQNVSTSSDRSAYQLALANKIEKGTVSILGADPGAGKTIISLMISASSKNKAVFLLPKRIMIDSLSVGIKSDMNVAGLEMTSSTYEENSYNSDITIASFDRVMISVYNRKHFKELIQVLSSDIFIDEFHEVMNIKRMLFFMKVFLGIRSKQNKKTVLLSGSPNQALCEFLGDVKVFKREELPEVHSSQFKLEVSDSDLGLPESETAVFFNRTQDCQKEGKFTLHSSFSEDDKLRNREFLFSNFGKNSSSNNRTQMYFSYLGSSSLDYSVRNLKMEICSPEALSQTLGRRNRWGNLEDGTVQIVAWTGRSYIWYDKKLLSNWYMFLVGMSGKSFTHRGFLEIYDTFCLKNKKSMSKYIDSLAKEGREEMKGFYPRYFLKEKKRTTSKSSSLNFRGDSFHCIAYDKENNRYEKISVSWVPEEFKVKGKKPTYREIFKRICEEAGIIGAYAHPNIDIGSEFHPAVFSSSDEEVNLKLKQFFCLRFYDSKLGLLHGETDDVY